MVSSLSNFSNFLSDTGNLSLNSDSDHHHHHYMIGSDVGLVQSSKSVSSRGPRSSFMQEGAEDFDDGDAGGGGGDSGRGSSSHHHHHHSRGGHNGGDHRNSDEFRDDGTNNNNNNNDHNGKSNSKHKKAKPMVVQPVSVMSMNQGWAPLMTSAFAWIPVCLGYKIYRNNANEDESSDEED